MMSLSKRFSLVSCGFLLCIGLSNGAQAGNAASAAEEMKSGQSDQMNSGGQADQMKDDQTMKSGRSEGGKTITGEVLRVEGDNYFVKGQDGKEVRLQTDQTTQKNGSIQQGDRIEAKVNDQNHAVSIRSAQGIETGQEREGDRTTDSTLDSGKSDSMGR